MMKLLMIKLSILLMMPLMIASCMHSQGKQKNDRLELIPEPDKVLREEYEKQQAISKSLIENIRFDFSAHRINTFGETIEVKAKLFNDNNDTVCFLSSTCDGTQYSLRYDTAKFRLTPFLNCNASYPKLIKIGPHGKYEFSAHFGYNSSETKIRLGFDFFSVSKSFDLKNTSLSNIFNRPQTDQTIVWAKEQVIK